MGATEKRLELSPRQKELLSAMGIEVWYLRQSASAEAQSAPSKPAAAQIKAQPQPQPQPQQQPQSQAEPAPRREEQRPTSAANPAPRASGPVIAEQPQADMNSTSAAIESVQPIEFTWFKCGPAMLIMAPEADAAVAKFANDVVLALAWRGGSKSPGAITGGDFRWPQLLDTGGTPTRALTVFINKHLGEQRALLGVSEEIAAELTPWLAELDLQVQEIPSLRAQLADASGKKALWQAFKKTV